MKELLKKLIPDFILYWYHWKLAFLGVLVYGFPSRKLKVIGVTGTKGKSTVVILAGKILNEAEKINPPQPPFTKGGRKTGWISSLTINDGKKEIMNPYHMTMPGRFFIQKTLARMVKNGCQYALVEVTSEGIKQHRHRFIKWAGAAFLNLAPEHLEAHGGFEKYRQAKEKLFAAAANNKESFGVYNLDDENAEWFLEYPINKKYGYSLDPSTNLKNNSPQPSLNIREGGEEIPPLNLRGGEGELNRFQISSIQLSANGSSFEIEDTKFKTNLLGEFNVYNCAAAAIIGQACGVDLEIAARALAKIKSIPGRLEIINEGQDFTVVVDLAHTPDSFEKVFALFKNLPHNKIISVFGAAGGGRDKWKRPKLGKIASQNSDQIFITNEDPYNEDPLKIADDILAGCDKNKADIVLDRDEAIGRALKMARTGDIVLVLGKGTEQTLVIGDKKYQWDDREAVREKLRGLISGTCAIKRR